MPNPPCRAFREAKGGGPFRLQFPPAPWDHRFLDGLQRSLAEVGEAGLARGVRRRFVFFFSREDAGTTPRGTGVTVVFLVPKRCISVFRKLFYRREISDSSRPPPK